MTEEFNILREALFRLCGALEIDDPVIRRRVAGQIKSSLRRATCENEKLKMQKHRSQKPEEDSRNPAHPIADR